MYFRHYVPWEHYPKNLYFEEIQNPYSAFSEFFFFADHPCFEKTQLTKLKESALSDDYYIGERVYVMEMLTTLFRAKLTTGLADFWVAANAIKACTKIVI